MTTVKAFNQGNSLAITIPRSFRSVMKIFKGDLLLVERKGDTLVFRKLSFREHSSGAPVVPPDSATSDEPGGEA